jgi:hypothetical protein
MIPWQIESPTPIPIYFLRVKSGSEAGYDSVETANDVEGIRQFGFFVIIHTISAFNPAGEDHNLYISIQEGGIQLGWEDRPQQRELSARRI